MRTTLDERLRTITTVPDEKRASLESFLEGISTRGSRGGTRTEPARRQEFPSYDGQLTADISYAEEGSELIKHTFGKVQTINKEILKRLTVDSQHPLLRPFGLVKLEYMARKQGPYVNYTIERLLTEKAENLREAGHLLTECGARYEEGISNMSDYMSNLSESRIALAASAEANDEKALEIHYAQILHAEKRPRDSWGEEAIRWEETERELRYQALRTRSDYLHDVRESGNMAKYVNRMDQSRELLTLSRHLNESMGRLATTAADTVLVTLPLYTSMSDLTDKSMESAQSIYLMHSVVDLLGEASAQRTEALGSVLRNLSSGTDSPMVRLHDGPALGVRKMVDRVMNAQESVLRVQKRYR